MTTTRLGPTLTVASIIYGRHFQVMTEYWKSTPKHWCEICRVWIADTPRIVKEHERSTLHQEKLSRRLSSLRREAEKEENEAARVARTVHDIESKAFAAYAADLEAQEKARPPTKTPVSKKSTPTTKEKRKFTVEVPKHPQQDIGGYSMPKTGKIGGQQRKIVKDKVPSHRHKKIKINEGEEEKAKRLRREAQERVNKRNMLNFGLG